MTDWKLQQMIKASGWPLAAEHLAPGADFNARLEGGLVPLHWACAAGKQGVVQHMLDHGANVLDAAADGQTPLTLAVVSRIAVMEPGMFGVMEPVSDCRTGLPKGLKDGIILPLLR